MGLPFSCMHPWEQICTFIKSPISTVTPFIFAAIKVCGFEIMTFTAV